MRHRIPIHSGTRVPRCRQRSMTLRFRSTPVTIFRRAFEKLAADSNDASRPLVPISRGKTDRREPGSRELSRVRPVIDYKPEKESIGRRYRRYSSVDRIGASIDAKSCVHLYELGEYAFPKGNFRMEWLVAWHRATTVRLHSAVGRDLRTDSSSATADTCFA